MNCKEHLTAEIFNVIRLSSKELRIESYVVGGYVRDLFLNRISKDIDIVSVGKGIDLAQKTASKLGNNCQVTVFKNFGTAMLHFEDLEVEFVGARKESYNRDSRKPIVENGSLLDDLSRRDFTINTLAISLNDHNFGELIDLFGGMKDLRDKTLITPLEPNITYSDDPLRMMRAIRFATQLNFKIEERSFSSITANKDRIHIVSKERITDELNKIILSKQPSIGFRLLERSGLLAIIFPEMQALKGVDIIDGKAHKDNFYHTIQVLDNLAVTSHNLWLRWSAILHDIAKPQTKKFEPGIGWTFHGHEFLGSKMVSVIFRELRLPLNEKMKYVQKMVLLHLRPISLVDEQITDSAVRRLLFEAGDDIDDLMKLCQADITSKNPEKVKKVLNNFEKVKIKLVELEKKDRIRNWQPPVDGALIMEVFNISPCPEIGIIKNAIREAILDGKIDNSYEKAYEFMLEKGREIGLKKVNND